MKTTEADKAKFFAYLDKTGADYTVDNDPSEEKLGRIRQAIQRKNQLLQKAIERFSNSNDISVSF